MSINRLAVILAVSLAIVGNVVSAQDYPSKPIRLVTSAAGGGSDLIARLIIPAISVPMGQSVVVDNRGGSVLAPEVASKSAPDGYTLLVNGGSVWAIPLLQKAPYDPIKDFSPISLLAREASVVVVHPSLPVKSIKELIALAKARPGELNYSSAATGSSGHLAGELFKSMAGVKILWVPYKGQPQAITALISGEVQMTIYNVGSVAPHVKSGKLKALAVTSADPSALVPDLPTVSASGVPGYEAVGMTGIWAPAKTSGSIIDRLNLELVRFLNMKDVKDRFLNAGVEAVGTTPEQFAIAIKSDIVRMAKTIKDAGIKVE